MGVVVVFTITVVTPTIGATATIGLLIAGQLAMGVLIDRYGWFGVEQVPLNWPRIVGVLMLGVGALLALRKVTHGAKVWVALWAVYIIWGSTYLGIELAGETIRRSSPWRGDSWWPVRSWPAGSRGGAASRRCVSHARNWAPPR